VIDKSYKKSFLSVSILASLMLGGCGETVVRDDGVSLKQPHEKLNRDYKDWTWNVGGEASIKNGQFQLTTTYYSGMPSHIKHMQLFLDTIPNKGFNGTNDWKVSGADYLIEDGSLYQSLSDTEWKWKYLGSAATLTSGSGNDKRTLFTEKSLLAKAIQTKSINVFLEVYDKDWNGAYTTIDLLKTKVEGDISVTPNDEALYKTIRKALSRGASNRLDAIALSPDKKTAIIDTSIRGYIVLKVYDITDPTKPVYQDSISHRMFDMPLYSIDNLKALDDRRVSYKLLERTHDHNTGRYTSASTTGVVYDVVSDYKSKKVLSKKYASESKADSRSILRSRLKKEHGDALTSFRFDYSYLRNYGVLSASLNGSKVRTFDVYDLSDRANPVKLHQLFEVSVDHDVLPHLDHIGDVSYYMASYSGDENSILRYYLRDSDHKKYYVERDILTKKIIRKELASVQ
jgi:hypothetical protein